MEDDSEETGLLWPVFNAFVRVETEVWNALDARLRSEHQLTLGRVETMQVLQDIGPCRVNDIAEALVITVGGVSKIVDRVEAAGHCRRRSHPDDRRSSLVELTPAGRRALARATGTLEAELSARWEGVLTLRQLQQLRTILGRLRPAAPSLTTNEKRNS
ncbi:DNA-binding MarR family transcriptional regulator [Motilibacter peucedani]|uniref:DNA-binding MarR family transcriptional regulator n=1 Tax=Motilibacter peucedani TaxID=598650 RepID=A0A420XMD9_9ACTN|nr:MarR family winged helix-turn-helix transcriptional regulator [Motilibacter peucedani]RKS71511.1 DNA-binding MarR family transcriptional regulator [Motilibacter peucedani]